MPGACWPHAHCAAHTSPLLLSACLVRDVYVSSLRGRIGQPDTQARTANVGLVVHRRKGVLREGRRCCGHSHNWRRRAQLSCACRVSGAGHSRPLDGYHHIFRRCWRAIAGPVMYRHCCKCGKCASLSR
ncbi:hypothetical protein HaLaN_11146 [Haematococcus lacustris]|uniref:Secreted protein n=1 Tax=Haematococcus lacustris TaxID=44745 RepID=A0A699Z6Y8_HAELA|nr:hypothetical protein HaLaN_11146 [Haematococcus lacustris]